MSTMASIDISAMSGLVAAADNAAAELPYDQWGFSSILGQVDLDTSDSAGIGKVNSWLEGAIPGLKRRLALAQAMEAQSPTHLDVVPIDESQLSNVPPEQAQADGQALAKQLADANGKIDPKLLAELTKYQDDPYFAQGFASSLTADQLAQIVEQTSNAGRSTSSPVAAPYQAWFAQYKGLLSAMGTTVATATRNTGALALPPGYAQSWTKAFEAEPGDSDFRPGEAMSLGYLLRFGQYSTPFLNSVSTDVYNYERSQQGKVWAPKAGATPEWPVDPTGNGMQTNVDVLSDVLAALGHNADAAQHFFDVPDGKTTTVTLDGQKVQVNDRLKYLLIDRTWSSSADSDEGTGLGMALQAASDFYRNSGPTGQVSAEIASQTLALLGNQIGQGSDDLGFGHTWNLYTNLRPAVAHIVASYMPDVYRILGGGPENGDQLGGAWSQLGDNPGFPDGMPYGAIIDKNLLTKIIKTLGEDESNIEIVTAGAAATQQQLMTNALQSSLGASAKAPQLVLQGITVPGVTNASIRGAGVLGWLVDTAYEGDSDKEEADKKRAELISKTLSIVTALPIIPAPEGKWSEAIFDQAKDLAIEKIGEGPEGDASGVYGKMDDASKQALTENTLNQLLQAGYFDPRYYSAANAADGGALNTPPPPEALKGKMINGKWVPDRPPSFDFNGENAPPANTAYQTWWDESGPQSWIQNNVLAPYDNQFPNIPGS